MSSTELPEDAPAPRLCHLVKWDDFDGYGFNLHAEKSKAGQYIGKVDEESPAEYANLREGDCIVEVNGVNIANENHKQVVERIKAIPNETKLLVIEEEGKKWYKERKLVIKSTQANVVYTKTPVPRPVINEKDVNENEPAVNGSTNHVPESPVSINSDMMNGSANHKIEENDDKVSEGETIRTTESVDEEEHEKVNEDRNKEEVSSSQNSTPKSLSQRENHVSGGSAGSTPDSPQSFKSSNSQPDVPKTPSTNGTGDLNLNMSASEMRQLLASRKKHDPKKIQMDLRKKYDIIQQM